MNNTDFNNIICLVSDNNFAGKRKRDTKLELVENALADLGLNNVDAAKLLERVQAHFDEKKQEAQRLKEAAKSNRKDADTIEGATVAQGLPVIDTNEIYIVSAAQNNTVTTGAHDQLRALANTLSAGLIYLPCFYNRSAFSTTVEDENEYFDKAIRDHVLTTESWLFEPNAVRLCAEAAIPLTTKRPVNAAQELNGGEICTVVGNPRQQLVTMPRLGNGLVRKAVSTGVVTGFNYNRGGAGAKAQKNHIFGGWVFWRDSSGAINHTNIVQCKDKTIILYFGHTFYHVNAKAEVKQAGRLPTAIKLGDLHCERKDTIQWGKAIELVQALNPEFVAADDVAHFESQSHHSMGNALHEYKHRDTLVINELSQVIHDINQLAAAFDGELYITESNHNAAVDKWISDSRNADSARNSKLFHLLSYLVREALDHGERSTSLALECAFRHTDMTGLPALHDSVEWGRVDIPKPFAGWDYSQHGHQGNNGARGSANAFVKIMLQLVTGHTHSPFLDYGAGVATTGVTGSLNQGYNRGGGSNWDHAHILGHCNGTVQMINTNPQKVLYNH